MTNQDLLLDLQRDAIDSLHKKIQYLEYDKYLIATILHTVYYSILSVMQVRHKDFVFTQFILTTHLRKQSK